jgi:hypothetical protein
VTENVRFAAGRGADRPDAAAAREGEPAAQGNPAGALRSVKAVLLHLLPAEREGSVDCREWHAGGCERG